MSFFIAAVNAARRALNMRVWSIAAIGLFPLLSQGQFPPVSVPPRPDATPPAGAPSESVKPVTELERLQFAAGDWVHEKEVDHGGAVGLPKLGSARSKAVWILKGQALQVSYKSRRAETEYEGRGLVTWDSESRRYRLDWYDSLGQVRRLSGDFDPAGALVFSTTFLQEGKTLKQKVSIKKDRNGRFLVVDERAIGNEPATVHIESLAAPAPVAPKAANVTSEPPTATTKPTTYR